MVHAAVPGRVRYRVPALRSDDSLRRALETGLCGNGIRSVSASTRTGTVLILFAPSHPLPEIERRVREAAARRPDMRSGSVFSEGPAWHSMDATSVFAALDSGPQGLESAAARALLRRCGPNTLARVPPRSALETFTAQFVNLPAALLAGSAALSLMTGGVFDAAIVLAVIGLNGLIGFFSETWTERTIASLETGDLPPVRVLRDSSETDMPTENLVPGDVIVLGRDQLVPADARVIAADRLTVNEAGLTGESIPVPKAPNVLAASRAPLAERRNMLFRGSMVTGGSGRAVIVATGEGTEISRIQALLATAERPETPLQQQLNRLGRLLVIGSVAAAGLVLLFGLARGRRFLPMLRSAVSLGVAAVPEGLPMMVTTTLAVSAGRLARGKLLVRRLEAIEALGSVQLVCFDKTGTLTLNRMTTTRLAWNGSSAALVAGSYRDAEGRIVRCDADPDLTRLLEICVLCNDVKPADEELAEFVGSPTETALIAAARVLGLPVAPTLQEHPRLSCIERAEGRRYMATLHPWTGGQRLVAVKGDPTSVLALCGSRSEAGEQHPLDAAARAAIEAANLAMAEAGLRVLGIAWRLAESGDGGLSQPPSDLIWLGLVGMSDPMRSGARDLVQALQRAGIATVMLTGDQPATALAIAAEAGLSGNGGPEIVEADALASAPPAAAGTRRIFARLTPAQKLQVVADLQRSGLRVAMVGDGVNDSPALKIADVGITLAASATAVARDVADIVLLGDDLAPLVAAFASGRAVRQNTRRAMRFLIATNLSEIMLMLLATGTGMVRPLTPAQLLWINLATDVLPALGLALEPPAPGLTPGLLADPSVPVVSGRDLAVVVRDAATIAGSALAAELLASARRGPEAGAAVGFTGLVAGQLLYALACAPRPDAGRGFGLPSPMLAGTLAASFAVQGAALFVPGLRGLAGRPLGLADLPLVAGAGLVPLLLAKALGGRK